MENIVNWDNLKSYSSTQGKSFEELCYQIVFEEYSSKGKLTSIDDSGGGDGVEFYLELPNGDIWGWQCKFFSRFSESGRKNQIKSSLQTAYNKHGFKLKKWFLCSKLNLTTKERDWFENDLATSSHKKTPVLPNKAEIELIHWGNSTILNHLRNHININNYFFTDKLLSQEWFDNKFKQISESTVIKTKYINELHIESQVDEDVVKILGDERLIDILNERKQSLQVNRFYEKYKEDLAKITANENIFEFQGNYSAKTGK